MTRLLLTLCLAALCCAPLAAQTAWDYRAHIEGFEGKSPVAYVDSRGSLTIGVGHRIEPSRLTLGLLRAHLTESQIDDIFFKDLMIAYNGALTEVPSFPSQPPRARLIIVALVFNLGQAGFHEFVDLRAALDKGDYHAAAKALQDSLWAVQLPTRAKAYTDTLNSLAP